MINLTELSVTVDSYTFNGEIIVPSPVMTAVPQDEKFNLSYSPNFQLKLEDTYSYLTGETVEVSFSYDGTDYTAYADVINRAGNIVTLQYADGLTSEDTPVVVHTLEFNSSSFSTSRDNYTGNTTQSSRVEVLYDSEQIAVSSQMLSGLNHCVFEPIQGHGGYFRAKSGLEVDEYADTVTCTYGGLTAQCSVSVTITDSTPEPQHTLAFGAQDYSCDANTTTGNVNSSEEVIVYLDDEPIAVSSSMLSGMTYCMFDEQSGAGGVFIPDTSIEDLTAGVYTDTVTVTYNGLTATTTVNVTIDDQPDEEPINDLRVELDEGDTKNLDNGVATNTIKVYSADPSSGIDYEVITSDCTFTCTNDDPENPAVTFNGNVVTVTARSDELPDGAWIILATNTNNGHTGEVLFYVLPPEE